MELTIQEILQLTGGRLERGDLQQNFSGVSSLDQAGKKQIAFLGNEKYFRDYLSSNAGLILLPEGVELRAGDSALIVVDNPSYAFEKVVKALTLNRKTFTAGIHPRAVVAEDASLNPAKVCIRAGAVVESGAVIGDGTEIGANSVVSEQVVIGADCLIHANVTIREGCKIGNRVILQPNCVVGSDGYGFELVEGEHKKVDQVGIVILEDDVEVGSCTTIDRARFGVTSIGKGTKIDNLVQIAHNVSIGSHCLIVSQSGIAGSAKLGDYVTLAAQAGVVGHIEVGDKTILMGRAVATKSLPPGKAFLGFPARPVKEEQKKMASLARLPRLIEQFKAFSQKNG